MQIFESNISFFQSDHEISAIAAEIGVDWSKAKDRVLWDGLWQNNIPCLDKKSRGKLSLISSIKNGTYVITFHTKRHGGESRTWTSKGSVLSDPREISRNRARAEQHRQDKTQIYAKLNGSV